MPPAPPPPPPLPVSVKKRGLKKCLKLSRGVAPSQGRHLGGGRGAFAPLIFQFFLSNFESYMLFLAFIYIIYYLKTLKYAIFGIFLHYILPKTLKISPPFINY